MKYDPDKTLLLTMRDAAKVERDELIRFNLKLIADNLQKAIDEFARFPTGENLTVVNGLWIHGIKTLNFAGNRNGGGSGGAGLPDPERQVA